MGNRLSKLYTRTGDDGTSGLANGIRVSKDSARMQAMGSIDELNSHLGMLLSNLEDTQMIDMLIAIQHDLFNMGGEISMPGHSFINADKVSLLEQKIDFYNADLLPLKDFILPGGVEAASLCHIARSVSRRVERDMVTLNNIESQAETSMQYINRLSDLLFVCARTINLQQGGADVLWKKELS